MNLLLDTNIFLEVLLGQEHANHAADLLDNNGKFNLFLTDFSLHSIGVLLFRRRRFDVYAAFVEDLKVAGIRVLSLRPQDVSVLTEVAVAHNLDFDDAYQYEIARRFDLSLVSFDSDFDRTDLRRITPQDVSERSK
jgi:hypothetical protein